MKKFFLILLAFTPITLGAQLLHAPPTAVFFLSIIAIIPLARHIGEATEKLSEHTGPAIGGLLNSTFGNATELIIGVFALRAGLIEVVKASLTGSIIGNLLLVLGSSMLAGGWRHKKQEFNRTAAMASGSSLFLVVIALVIPALFLQTVTNSAVNIIQELSVFVSLTIIILYIASLWFALRTHKHLYLEEVGYVEATWSKKKSLFVLIISTLAVSFVSNALVGSIEPLISVFHWTELFVGVIFVAIVGNAAEHASAITMAMKNRVDLALQISIGSATQIAMFVAPFLVLISLLFSHPMSLIFNSFELIAVVLSIILVNLIVADGESNWLEGIQLVAAYSIMAVAFFFHP